jgi:hypothetical protein
MKIIFEKQDFEQLEQKIDQLNLKLIRVLADDPERKRWITNSEAIKILNVSTRTLQNYRDTGKLPFSKIGTKIYYKASDIDGVLQKYYVRGFNVRKGEKK